MRSEGGFIIKKKAQRIERVVTAERKLVLVLEINAKLREKIAQIASMLFSWNSGTAALSSDLLVVFGDLSPHSQQTGQ